MTRPVFVDTNVLINLVHVDRLDLLGQLRPFQFLVPAEVLAEIRRPNQNESVAKALKEGWLGNVRVEGVEELEIYAGLVQHMGSGEAACLTLAAIRRGFLATSDKKRKFMREARSCIGRDRIVRLADIFVRAIRQGHLTVEQADGYKEFLAENRFRMKIDTFADLL